MPVENVREDPDLLLVPACILRYYFHSQLYFKQSTRLFLTEVLETLLMLWAELFRLKSI